MSHTLAFFLTHFSLADTHCTHFLSFSRFSRIMATRTSLSLSFSLSLSLSLSHTHTQTFSLTHFYFFLTHFLSAGFRQPWTKRILAISHPTPEPLSLSLCLSLSLNPSHTFFLSRFSTTMDNENHGEISPYTRTSPSFSLSLPPSLSHTP